MAGRKRNYAAEYRRRLALGRERGYSRQVARGRHAKEGGRLPDGSRGTVISVQEILGGRLRVSTLETMHRMNAGLRGPHPEKWLAAARRRGWAVVANQSGGGFHTQDDVPSSIINAMVNRERNHFYGY